MHVSVMRDFFVSDERTNERTNKPILGVGWCHEILNRIEPDGRYPRGPLYRGASPPPPS